MRGHTKKKITVECNLLVLPYLVRFQVHLHVMLPFHRTGMPGEATARPKDKLAIKR